MNDDNTKISGVIHTFKRFNTKFRFFVTHSNDTVMSHHVSGVFYEEEELHLISEFYTGGAILDVGANVGNHSVFFSKVMGADIVLPFEPNVMTRNVLLINLLLNECQNIDKQFCEIALGTHSCFLETVVESENNLGGATLQPSDTASIRCLRGDDIFAARAFSFIKIDVEGMELDVLEGLSASIERWRPTMFVEVFDSRFPQFKAWCDNRDYEIVTNFKRYPEIDNYMVRHKTRISRSI